MSDEGRQVRGLANRFGGTVAVVTGGASGIGRSTAIRLGSEGAAVAVIDRNGEGAEAVAAEVRGLGGAACGYPCDIAKSAEVRTVAETVQGDLGVPGVL